MTLFFSVFVGIGMFMGGAAVGSGHYSGLIFGSVFGGLPLFMTIMIGGFVPIVLIPFGIIMFIVGFIKGRANPGGYVWTRGGGGGGWRSGGGFSSGGGGSSGRW
jgi:uncharacterized protein